MPSVSALPAKALCPWSLRSDEGCGARIRGPPHPPLLFLLRLEQALSCSYWRCAPTGRPSVGVPGVSLQPLRAEGKSTEPSNWTHVLLHHSALLCLWIWNFSLFASVSSSVGSTHTPASQERWVKGLGAL